jgi:transaldolase
MKRIEDLKIKIFSDGAMLEDFRQMVKQPYIKGFTTNPSLMKKAGVTDYGKFIKDVLSIIQGKPISFEVICDKCNDMKQQAKRLASFGENVYVKIPITNTLGESSAPLVDELTHEGIKVNVTAMLTLDQVKDVARALKGGAPAVVSIFAGRIADTGIDPVPVMMEAKKILKDAPNAELLWASPREILNIFQAEEAGCDIITVAPETLKKIGTVGYDLKKFSLDTVKMFFDDGISSGLKI